MKEIAGRLQKIIADYLPLLENVSEEKYAEKTNPEKWSRKEILGHLIDSAQTNIRRFIVSQYEQTPKIVYAQDHWVAISNYQNYPVKDIIALWTLLNKHICQVLSNTSAEMSQRLSATNNPQSHTIAWLASDYIKHLLHHLHQVLDLDPIAYP